MTYNKQSLLPLLFLINLLLVWNEGEKWGVGWLGAAELVKFGQL